MRRRARRRRPDALAAARRVDPTDATALAAVPLDVLDDLSRSKVVEVDNAVRTSDNELALAIEEFGDERTAPFTRAVDSAKAALAQAFTVRQQLDDSVPETPAQRRELLTRVIVSAASADRELESQTEAFEQLRDLVINAPSRLDGLTQQYVELTSRVDPAEQHMAELNKEFGAAALASISGNVATARSGWQFADRNISVARDLAGQAVSGQQSRLVDAVRAAESLSGKPAHYSTAWTARLTTSGAPCRTCRRCWPTSNRPLSVPTSNCRRATSRQHTGDLIAARDAAARALDSSGESGSVAGVRGAADPLGTFAQLSKADARPQPIADHQGPGAGKRRTAEPVVRTGAVHRGVAGAGGVGVHRHPSRQHRPRGRVLGSPKRSDNSTPHTTRKSTNLTEAIAYANGASTLAAQAQSLANADVQSAQRAYAGRGDTTPARCWAASSSATCSAAAYGVDSAAGARPRSAVRRAPREARPVAASWAAAGGSEPATTGKGATVNGGCRAKSRPEIRAQKRVTATHQPVRRREP